MSESRYVTSKSPVPVLDGGLKASGIRGISNGGSCERFPVVFTVVFSNIILTLAVPVHVSNKTLETLFAPMYNRKKHR